jgi:hypothetical protein
MINPAQPQTYEEHVEILRTLVTRLSDIQFQLGMWAVETLTQYPMVDCKRVDCKRLADDINIGYKALNEWVNMRRFWLTDGLPDDLTRRIADLHEERRNGILNYSHFRAAKRMGTQDKTLTREQQVELAVAFLEALMDSDDKHSMMDARVMAVCGGDEFEQASIRYDSLEEDEDKSALDIARIVEQHIRGIRKSGNRVRVVVYEVNPNA